MRMQPALLVLLCAVVLGCSEDDSAPSPLCGGHACSAQCVQLRGENCDILDEDCRQRILDAVACVRGTPGELPPVRKITPEEYRAEQTDSGDEDAGVEEQAAEEAWSTGLALLGLLDPDATTDEAALDERTESIAAYYDADERAITLLDRDRAEDSDEAESLLAHELVHALQDQHMGLHALSQRTGQSSDSWFARGCLIEGEASLYEDLAFSLLNGLSVDPGYWDADLAWRLKYAQGEVATRASPYSSLWLLHYPVGTRFVTDAWLHGGDRAVQGLYWAAPQSTIYWMHGYDAFVRRDGQLVRPLACRDATAPSGYEETWTASFGAFAAYAFFVRNLDHGEAIPIEAAWQDALQWRQDRLFVFTNEADGTVAVSWRILFDDPAVAEAMAYRLASRFEDRAEGMTAVARDGELEILAAQARSLLLEWEGTDPGACPAIEDE